MPELPPQERDPESAQRLLEALVRYCDVIEELMKLRAEQVKLMKEEMLVLEDVTKMQHELSAIYREKYKDEMGTLQNLQEAYLKSAPAGTKIGPDLQPHKNRIFYLMKEGLYREFDIAHYSDMELYQRFRMSAEMITKSAAALGFGRDLEEFKDIPEGIQKPQHTSRFTPFEAYCVVLARMASFGTWTDLELVFLRSGSELSSMFNFAIDIMTAKFREKTMYHQELMTPTILSRFADHVAKKTDPTKPSVPNVVIFVDGSKMKVARNGDEDIQREFYDGKSHFHALGFQGMTLPNGMSFVSNTFTGNHNDKTLWEKDLLSRSGELGRLLKIPRSNDGSSATTTTENDEHEAYYICFGDKAYVSCSEAYIRSSVLEGDKRLTNEEFEFRRGFNKNMSSVRICVEWSFKDLKKTFPYPFTGRLQLSKQNASKALYVSCLLVNIINILQNGNQTCKFFHLEDTLPSLAEYLA